MWSHVCLMPGFQSQGRTNLHHRVISSHCLKWKCEENSTSSCVYIFAFCIYVLSWAILFYSAHRGDHLALLQEFQFRFSYGLRAMPNSPWYWKILNNDVMSQSQSVLACCETARAGHFRWGQQAVSKAVFWRPAGALLGIWDTGKLFNCVNRQLYPLSSFIVFCCHCHCPLFDLCLHCFESYIWFLMFLSWHIWHICLSYILNTVQDELSYHGLLP